ncbi:MAG TPA: hypothetical protein VGO62_14300, partial [Myxococcota bacterium]
MSSRSALVIASLLALCATTSWATTARAASSGTPDATGKNFLRTNGGGQPVGSGDWVTNPTSPGLHAQFHYFIEVPSGLPNLVVEVFDADAGRGGNNEGVRDLELTNNFNTTVSYSLFNPNGVQVGGTITCSNGNNPAVCTDNAWSPLFGTQGSPIAGHWELRV